jgi:hypothetical protein
MVSPRVAALTRPRSGRPTSQAVSTWECVSEVTRILSSWHVIGRLGRAPHHLALPLFPFLAPHVCQAG